MATFLDRMQSAGRDVYNTFLKPIPPGISGPYQRPSGLPVPPVDEVTAARNAANRAADQYGTGAAPFPVTRPTNSPSFLEGVNVRTNTGLSPEGMAATAARGTNDPAVLAASARNGMASFLGGNPSATNAALSTMQGQRTQERSITNPRNIAVRQRLYDKQNPELARARIESAGRVEVAKLASEAKITVGEAASAWHQAEISAKNPDLNGKNEADVLNNYIAHGGSWVDDGTGKPVYQPPNEGQQAAFMTKWRELRGQGGQGADQGTTEPPTGTYKERMAWAEPLYNELATEAKTLGIKPDAALETIRGKVGANSPIYKKYARALWLMKMQQKHAGDPTWPGNQDESTQE